MFVGRSDELDVLRACIGSMEPVVVVGPAGIGKSTLALEGLGTSGAFRRSGALALLAWSPLLIFRRLLGGDLPVEPHEVAAAVVRGAGGPVLLDDLQWVDDASLEVLGALAGQIPIVATVRVGEERSEFVLDVLTLLGARRIDLDGLGCAASIELVDQLHPELDADDRERLISAADGNPLLLEQLPWSSDLSSPSLVSALLARTEDLSADGRLALDRLAVLARPVGVDVLGEGADELIGVGLAERSGDAVAISHALLAELVVEGLGARADEVRRGLVESVEAPEAAHLLEAVGALDEARARALEAAEGAPDRLRAPLLALAVRCASDLDPVHRMDAARCYTAISQPAVAVELCSVDGLDGLSPLERGGLLIARAEATFVLGRQQEAFDLVMAALEDVRGSGTVLEVIALAGATLVNTSISFDGRSALDQAREAVALADRLGEEQLMARTRLAAVMLIAGEPGWSELYAQAIDEARSVGDEQARHTAVVGRLIGHWFSGDPVAAEAQAQAELQTLPRDEFPSSWLILAAYGAVLGMAIGRPPSELIEQFQPILVREPYFRVRPLLETTVVVALADDGQHVAAEALASGSVGRSGSEPQWTATAHWGVIEAAWLAGRWLDAAAEVDALLATGAGDYPAAIHARLVAGHAAREGGGSLRGAEPVPRSPRGLRLRSSGKRSWPPSRVTTRRPRSSSPVRPQLGADSRPEARPGAGGLRGMKHDGRGSKARRRGSRRPPSWPAPAGGSLWNPRFASRCGPSASSATAPDARASAP